MSLPEGIFHGIFHIPGPRSSPLDEFLGIRGILETPTAMPLEGFGELSGWW